tara:strand:- start:8058 stop:8885 length:828 start_codon:yes stop_codon:yes gene_type:complete
MFKHKYYNGVIRKYVVYFGTLFNNIEIDRTNTAGEVVQTIKVPISYGPKSKYLVRGDTDPNLDRQVAVQLPRMSFEMTNFRYDSQRRMNPLKKFYAASDQNYNLRSVGTPTPFNIDFELNIAVKNAEDGVRILEQILPYFTPEYTATLKLLDSMPDLKFDIPVVFLNLATRDEYEGDFVTRRQLMHTLTFEVKGYVFGPITEKSDIIKQANVSFHVDPGAAGSFAFPDTAASKVVITPGVLANGSPTSNASVSINIDDINANSNYGYITANTFNG